MKKLCTSILLVFYLAIQVSFAQNFSRTVAILNTTVRNSELNDGELYSAKHLLKVAGIPFIVTTNVDSAIMCPVVITSSKLQGITTTTEEKDSLIAFVNRGGTLIAPNISDTYLYPLFGISNNFETDTRHYIMFDTVLMAPEFRWLDDSLEQTICIGRTTYTHTADSRNYTLSTATEMAHFEDGTPAIARNFYGSGRTYSLGISYKTMILLPQINKDDEAQRTWSNGFEPTTDAWIFFVKNICTIKIPNSVWLHTSPYNSKSTLILTHDIDAQTSYDTMHYYADYERSMNLTATYMCTTHYLHDDQMSAYFNPTGVSQIQYIMSQGMKIGSHSMGHFTDFDIDTICPLGVLGNTTSSYTPYSHIDSSTTTFYRTVGSTVLGETEVSKNLLQSNLGIPIRAFRAGYLCYNVKLVTALDTLGYVFNTTYSANDVLTNFPYRNHFNRSSTGALSNVWEIPMTLSDVFMADRITSTNYPDKVNTWCKVIEKNTRNYAPTIILIHPTRYYKLFAEASMLNRLPDGVGVFDLETYGDYWLNRDALNFSTKLSNDTVTIVIPHASYLTLNSGISFVVDNGQSLSLIKAEDEYHNPIPVFQTNWDNNGVLVHFGYYTPVSVPEINSDERDLYVNTFPNPFSDNSTIEVWLKQASHVNIAVYNTLGQLVRTIPSEYMSKGIHRIIFNADGLPTGTYFCRITTDSKSVVKKLMISK
jgi:hypothetical protein